MIAVMSIVFATLLICMDFSYRDKYRKLLDEMDAEREQTFFHLLSRKNIAKRLADKLEIQADGGDDPAVFVQ